MLFPVYVEYVSGNIILKYHYAMPSPTDLISSVSAFPGGRDADTHPEVCGVDRPPEREPGHERAAAAPKVVTGPVDHREATFAIGSDFAVDAKKLFRSAQSGRRSSTLECPTGTVPPLLYVVHG